MPKERKNYSRAYEAIVSVINNRIMPQDGQVISSYDIGNFLKTSLADPDIKGGPRVATLAARTLREPERYGFTLEHYGGQGANQGRWVYRRYIPPTPTQRAPEQDGWTKLAELMASIELLLTQAKDVYTKLAETKK